MTGRKLFKFGVFAPIIFIFNAILGGALRPGYSHLADTVSELFTVGAPNRLLLTCFYSLFSIFLVLFGLGLLNYVQNVNKQQRIGSWGAYLFILVGVLNILTATVFPQDPWGSPPTFPGQMHKFVSAGITMLSITYMLLFGIWFRRTAISKPFFWYSILTIILATASGIWFILSVDSAFMGLAERAAILMGFQWTFVFAVFVLNNDPDLAKEDHNLIKNSENDR